MVLQTPAFGRKPVGKAQGVAGCRDSIRKDSRVLSFRHPHRYYSRLYPNLTGPNPLSEKAGPPLPEILRVFSEHLGVYACGGAGVSCVGKTSRLPAAQSRG